MTVFLLVMVYPTVQAVLISVQRYGIAPGSPSSFVGLANYSRAFTDPIFWRSLANGGAYLLATVPFQIALGLACAVALNGRFAGRTVFRALIYIPVITSWVVASVLFRYLFGTADGAVNALLTGVGAEPVDWFSGRWTAMAVISLLGIWKGVGWAMLIFLAALQAVPPDLHEAAAVDGAGNWRRFRSVTLPAIQRTLAYVTILLTIGGFNVFISVYLITGGGPADQTQVPLTYLYRQAFNLLDFGYGSAIAFSLTAAVFVLSAAQLWFTDRRDSGSPA